MRVATESLVNVVNVAVSSFGCSAHSAVATSFTTLLPAIACGPVGLINGRIGIVHDFRSDLLSAMGAVKLEHSDRAQHRAGIMQQLRQFWMDDHLCDVVLKSHDGAEHRAHTAVLSAASVFFKNLLGGSFLEAERVQQKQPVEIAASKAALSALLDYIYDGQPEVPVEVGLEVLRLAEAYDLPKLAGEIEAGIRACLDSSVALQVLQEAHGLHSLRAACEDKVAEEFETCSQHPDFGKLTASQLARILKREDLGVSREEAVVNALFTWNKVSKDGHAFLEVLLQHVDFNSLSIENLLSLSRTSLSGQSGDDLHREVEDVLIFRKRTQSPGAFQSKRRRLQNWSPFFGASAEASGREVLSLGCGSLRWHQGELFAVRHHRIVSWKPGDPATSVRPVVGEGAAVTGINDLGSSCYLAISPSGEMFVSDWQHRRLLRFQNGSGDVVVGNADASALFYLAQRGAVCGEPQWENIAKVGRLHARDCDCLREPSSRHAVLSVPGVCNQGRGDLSFGQSDSKFTHFVHQSS